MRLNNEIRIGMMVSAVVVLLAGLSIKTGNLNFTRAGYVLKVRFGNIDGVNVNAPVMVNGFEVGIVKDIAIKDDADETQMELTLWLDDKAKIREGAQAYVKNLGLLGEKYVGLSAGPKGGKILSPETVIEGVEPSDLGKLMSDGQEIAAQLKEISQSINGHLQKNKEAIDSILANMDVTVKNMSSITKNVDERLEMNKAHIDEMMVNLHAASVNLDELSYDLKANPWKLLYRPKEQKKKDF
ncbi:MAG: Mammalian cell entry related domain protein [Candidatus Kaiserbacteria bacterium GW2011_GWA2_49_19]|uniref:Mammalian cell entry related domain protein n=1 Tax=Candidatus Kaiserbacteria bacterium GW2011_GWA2_49_19 TaxID=1618669 RepID=A0A0G1VRK6_9BACT|nr:MAG: Mammalian cell entry related domain protein [Candidatus Kaiserbacteria bacterium GW2011_GWA2_49_19]